MKHFFKTIEYKNKIDTGVYLMRIADVIFKARNEIGITQGKLAKKIGTTQRIISMIENANYNMSIVMMYRLFKYLGKEMMVDGKDMVSGKEKSYTVFYSHNSFTKTEPSEFFVQKTGNHFLNATIKLSAKTKTFN